MAARLTSFLTLVVMLIISGALAAQPRLPSHKKKVAMNSRVYHKYTQVSQPSKKGGVSSKSIPKAHVPASQRLKKGGELLKSIPKAHAPTIQPPKKVGNPPKS
ncbi:hypothetical protein Adt_41559 [Abeliophyllum distichum]|uniref:Uncharacterized protein n=1 Tax=Abeliophyllum distichum TaxID=126358 RepID=A0ABD1PP71_9LAMI